MLRNASSIIGNSVKAKDGAIGSIDDMFFDDEQWILRWIVVDTGNWLPGRRVLLPPHICGIPDAVNDQVPVDLFRKQIEESPPADEDYPSRQTEADLYAHYGWDPYWGAGSGYPGAPLDFAPDLKKPAPAKGETEGPSAREDAHLRSMNSVHNYTIQALDGDFGHAEDFIIDDSNWRIAYMVIDTQKWWPGKRVLISPRWLDGVSWSQRKIFVVLARDRIKNSPAYVPGNELDPEYESQLAEYYGDELG
jgi:PRC-barrel domain